MEIEKPFKCTTCNAQFTNEDHLFVHKRRHEMSLNLKPGQSQSQLESFVDETPTPTRFFRNCEEVGLFQDLQNVNPFDEQFAKASSGTPSADGVHQFDFSIALPSALVTGSSITDSLSSSSSRRRYSDQDTLNTPQVFGYLLNSTNSTTTGTNSSTTTTILNPLPSSIESKVYQQDVENQNISGGEEQVLIGSLFPTKGFKTKAALKLNLSPITPSIQSTLNINSNVESDLSSIKQSNDDVILHPEKKVELLERNRAAASRSRQRRKQWVSNLESRCEHLETLLRQTKHELLREKAENQALRCELSKHEDCSVTQKQIKSLEEIQLQHQGIQIVLVQQPKHNQPNILRQVSQQPLSTSSISASDTFQLTQPIFPLSLEIVQQPQIPPTVTVSRKRGRPRRGEERRVNAIFLPATTTNTSGVSVKLPLPPVSHAMSKTALVVLPDPLL